MRVLEPSSRVLARFAPRMRSDLATSAGCSAGRCDFASRLSASQALRRFARSRGKTKIGPSLEADAVCQAGGRQITSCRDREEQRHEDGEAHGSAMLELRERDELPQPCQSTTEDGHIVFASEIAEWQLKGNICKIRRTHASREERAARRSKGGPTPLLHSFQNLPRPSRRLPGEKSGPSASRPRRPRARCERSPRERWVLSRHAASFLSWREPVAAHTSERSPGARESGKKRTKVTRNAPRRIPRSSAPRRATRSSRASSRRTRRTPGRTSTTSRRRFARVP